MFGCLLVGSLSLINRQNAWLLTKQHEKNVQEAIAGMVLDLKAAGWAM